MIETAKGKRLVAVANELGVGRERIVEHLKDKGFQVDDKPTTKLTDEMYAVLLKEFQQDKSNKDKADQISLGKIRKEEVVIPEVKSGKPRKDQEQDEVIIRGMTTKQAGESAAAAEVVEPPPPVHREPPPQPKIVGKIDLDKKKPVKEKTEKEK